MGYDVELERKRLGFEMKRYEDEREERAKEREAARLREEKEETRRKLELDREETRRREDREWQEKCRQADLEREEKCRKDALEREEKRRKEDAEAAKLREEKEAKSIAEDRTIKDKEMRIQRDQLAWHKAQEKRESEKQQTPAARIKYFGGVLKNVMPKFPSDVADVPIFFEGVEHLFESF
jgi:hypothetical protein